MKKEILMITCSLSGYTNLIGELIQKELEKQGHTVHMLISDDVTSDDLQHYQHILLGTYTYSMVSMKSVFIPFELEELMDRLAQMDLSDKQFGVFGSCDTMYDVYGGALDLLMDELKKLGAKSIIGPLKIELEPNSPQEEVQCRQFANDYLQM